MKKNPNNLLLLKTSVAGHSPFTKGVGGFTNIAKTAPNCKSCRMNENPNNLLLPKTSVAGHSPFTKGVRGIYEYRKGITKL